MCALTRFFAVGGLFPLGVVSCAPLAARAPFAKLVLGVWLYLSFWAVLCPCLALSNLKAGPREAHVGFVAFLWTGVLTGFSECIPNEDWSCKLLCVSLNLVGMYLWKSCEGFIPLTHFKKRGSWWRLGHRWCPVIDCNKLAVVFSSGFGFFFSLCFWLRSNGMVTFCIIYLRSPEPVHCCCLKFFWGKLGFFSVRTVSSGTVSWERGGLPPKLLLGTPGEHLALIPWGKEKEM